MKLKRIVSGPMLNNTYLLVDDQTGDAAIIDPGQHNTELLDLLRSDPPFRVRYIVGTHGHFDHMLNAVDVQELTGAEILIHAADEACLHDDRENLFAQWSPRRSKPARASRKLADGDTFSLGEHVLRVLHTPGHTPGSICILCGDWLFTGDTLFPGTVGRCDLPRGNFSDMLRSVEKLRAIPGDKRVLPGHEQETTLNRERETNPYFTGTYTE